jgi:hypothetical protein
MLRNLLALAIARPHAATDGARDAHAQAHRRGHDDKSDDDLSPQPLLAGQVLEQIAAARALVRLPLVHDGLARRPHGALLDAAVDGRLGLLCRGRREREPGFDIALGDVHVEVCLALDGAAGVERAAGLGVLVEGRVRVRRVRRVEGHFLLCEFCRGGRHGRLGGGGRAQGRLRLGQTQGSLDCDAKGDGLVLLVCRHCDVCVRGCFTRGRTVF